MNVVVRSWIKEASMVVRWILICIYAGCFLLAPQVSCQGAETTVQPPGHNPRSAENVPTVLLGAPCEETVSCSVKNSICKDNKCQCGNTYPVQITNELCLNAIHLNEKCDHKQQCLWMTNHTHCDTHKKNCVCNKGYTVSNPANSSSICTEDKHVIDETYVDPTMIGVLVGLVAMFIVMCVVLRMFSKARFADNRTVFNSPRLLKLSLAAKRSDRRASNVSMGGGSRPASRHASIQSGLNMLKKSPTNSQKGSRESLPQNSVHTKPSGGSPVKHEPLINVESPKDEKNTVVNIPDNNIAAV